MGRFRTVCVLKSSLAMIGVSVEDDASGCYRRRLINSFLVFSDWAPPVNGVAAYAVSAPLG